MFILKGKDKDNYEVVAQCLAIESFFELNNNDLIYVERDGEYVQMEKGEVIWEEAEEIVEDGAEET